MRATTTLLLLGLLPALGEYFEPAGTAASAVSSDDNAKELGGKTTTTRKKKARKPAGYDVDNLEVAHPLAARLNARFRLGVPSDDLHAAGVLVHINDRTDDPAHRWKPCYKARNHGQYWASK